MIQDKSAVHKGSASNKVVFSWALYDWANSAFACTVMAGFFPVFFKEFWSAGVDSTVSTARLGTAVSLGSLVIAVLSPVLGALSDLRQTKKIFCGAFMLLGAISTIYLAAIEQGQWQTAALVYGIAMFGFTASTVFYDSLLPSIAPGVSANRASSLGYGLGYLGGGVLFAINVLMYLKPDLFGLDGGVHAVRLSFISAGVWWLIFSLPLFLNVPEPPAAPHTEEKGLSTLIRQSLGQLKESVTHILGQRNLRLFLFAYWLYIDGVFTIMTMAVDFGISLGFKASDLIAALLIVQFIGFPCALIFSRFSDRWGCKKPILVAIGVYALTTILATRMTEAWHFYLLAVVIGMVQGGVQALSRSLFSQMTPAEVSGEYFGLFNLIGKFASIMGPALVGLIAYFGGESRNSLLGLLLLFAAGAFLLTNVKEPSEISHKG